MSFFNVKSTLSKAAYCAIFVTLAGCASHNSTILNAAENDALSADNVSTRAKLIPNLATAQLMEKNALARQKAADDKIVGIESVCLPKFLVNKCINDAKAARNTEWDNAQIDLTAARRYIQSQETKQQQQARQKKYADYQAEEAARAPERAANRAAFEAKRAAFIQRQADYAAQQIAEAPMRAANVSAFQAKQDELNALKKKRVEDAAKRAAKAAAKSQ